MIGVDFDNTIADYDAVMHAVALEAGLIPGAPAAAGKRDVRDRIRTRADGEQEWRAVQAAVYGPRIDGAQLFPGVDRFFRECRARGLAVCVVSHKTEFAAADRTGTNLRDAALGWMTRRGLFDADGAGLAPDRVFFELTSADKAARIARMACTHFIDDLEDTFLEPAFPAAAEAMLFDPRGSTVPRAGARVFRSWDGIARHIFDACG